MIVGIKRAINSIIAAACLLATCCSSSQPDLVTVDESVSAKMSIMNFDGQEEAKIREAATTLFGRRCTEAFTTAGLRSPLQVVSELGVLIRPSKDLYLYTARDLGLTHDLIRKTYAAQFSTCRAQGGTIRPLNGEVRLTVDDRPRIFLHDSAFLGESLLFGRLSLRNVLTHEFIHAGGQPPTPGWLAWHDLAGFRHYDTILKACD